MTNSEIKCAAYEAVIAYEKDRGRTASIHEADGYDLRSTGGGGHRHIEVKGTTKESFGSRWLEPRGYKAFRAEVKFWLYLVTNVGGHAAVHEYGRRDLRPRYAGRETKHMFRFIKEDFER
jgi:hypothetical protein